MRLPAVIACAAVCIYAAAVPPLEIVETGNDAEHTDACGVWETTASGSVLRFSRLAGARDAYTVAVIESSDYRIAPGTIIGSLTATAVPLCYDAEFISHPAESSVSLKGKKQNFIVEFDSRMRSCTFKAYRRGKRVSLRRLLPYLFRIAVIESDNRPEGIDGAVRIDTTPSPVVL